MVRARVSLVGVLIVAACGGGGGEQTDAADSTASESGDGDPTTGDGDPTAGDGDPGDGDPGDGDPTTGDGDPGDTPAAGLFIAASDLDRARIRAQGNEALFTTQASLVAGRAASAMNVVADPFFMDDVTQIRFGWCEPEDDVDDTLREATGKFEDQSDDIRTLALHYALSDDVAAADHCVALMLAWAQGQTVVNLHDLGVDYGAGTLDDQTDGYCSDRPWNFALDALWQAYGLINVADAYLLLTRNGYALDPGDDAIVRDWLLRLTEAVNSSFNAWTKWADSHQNSSSYERYRADNHLSWGLAGLIAGAAALEDDALASYVLDGGEWTDSRGGAYANPSSQRSVIDWAIEPDGRIYEEKILRDPPIGYSFFHLWAMMLVARVAEVHYEQAPSDLWSYPGDDGGGMELAHDRYAGFILGSRVSPEPQQEGDLTTNRWLYEAAVSRWDKPEHRAVIDSGDRNTWINQSIGAVPLLIGVDP